MNSNNNIEVSVEGSNSFGGSNLANYSDTYEKWDSEEGEICPQCFGTGLDRDEVWECPACWGEGYTVPVDRAL